MTLCDIWRCSQGLEDQERQVLAFKNVDITVIRGDKKTGKINFHLITPFRKF